MPGPVVPERLLGPSAASGRVGDIHAGTTGQAHSLAGCARGNDGRKLTIPTDREHGKDRQDVDLMAGPPIGTGTSGALQARADGSDRGRGPGRRHAGRGPGWAAAPADGTRGENVSPGVAGTVQNFGRASRDARSIQSPCSLAISNTGGGGWEGILLRSHLAGSKLTNA